MVRSTKYILCHYGERGLLGKTKDCITDLISRMARRAEVILCTVIFLLMDTSTFHCYCFAAFLKRDIKFKEELNNQKNVINLVILISVIFPEMCYE